MIEQLVCHCCESVDVAEQYELCGQCYQDWLHTVWPEVDHQKNVAS